MSVFKWLVWMPSLCIVNATPQAADAPLVLEATIPLPGVKGRIDHLSVDTKRNRLFVAALGNDTVEVVDLSKKRRERSLSGFGEPQGVLYVPEPDRLYVANGTANRVDILDGATLAVRKRLDADDADNLRLDVASNRAIVGYGGGALRLIDLASEQAVGEIELPAHPESFQLEREGTRIFINVPKAHQVTVVDRRKRQVVAGWDIGSAAANFPMALDERNQRLFVGARVPAVMLVYDTAKGSVVAKVSIGADADDLFYDRARRRVYVICGEGRVDVVAQESADRYTSMASVQTAPRARTGLFVPDLGRLYVAAPAADGQEARVLVYRAQ